ncbi:hypothetical protein HOLleu_30787 [Holothuria leucospilota]|uniref:Uncharacterized protein n=1 Tax=Holothuria leucospilota TaxID=206669 RepID=A0A9Q1BKX8_HOLLE|nr:hypothetical protein HOLleu_30787 [Holothuria leucospilota]
MPRLKNHCSTGDRTLFHRRQVIGRLVGSEWQDRASLWFRRTSVRCVTEVSMVMPCACAVNTQASVPENPTRLTSQRIPLYQAGLHKRAVRKRQTMELLQGQTRIHSDRQNTNLPTTSKIIRCYIKQIMNVFHSCDSMDNFIR